MRKYLCVVTRFELNGIIHFRYNTKYKIQMFVVVFGVYLLYPPFDRICGFFCLPSSHFIFIRNFSIHKKKSRKYEKKILYLIFVLQTKCITINESSVKSEQRINMLLFRLFLLHFSLPFKRKPSVGMRSFYLVLDQMLILTLEIPIRRYATAKAQAKAKTTVAITVAATTDDDMRIFLVLLIAIPLSVDKQTIYRWNVTACRFQWISINTNANYQLCIVAKFENPLNLLFSVHSLHKIAVLFISCRTFDIVVYVTDAYKNLCFFAYL